MIMRVFKNNLALVGEEIIMILRCRDLLPFIWSGCRNKWLVVVVKCLHLKKKKRNKTALAVTYESKATNKLSNIIQSTDGMLVCMHKNDMV
jgi:hypothetical protein